MRPRVDAIPFESQHQYMATLHDHETPGRRIAWMKGSVEKVLDACVDAETPTGEMGTLDRDSVVTEFRAMASRGLRVLALAKREIDANSPGLARDDVRSGMTFLGLQGMIDPPRREAFDAVRRCREAGVRVKMITGDHPLTARAVAESLNLSDARSADGTAETLTGRQIEELEDDELAASVEKTDVFARVTPEQKLRLVRALQSLGHVAAMTGDGVNDAPALKQPDIGIAMGQAGTEVAKEAADIVLADDNFATIVSAVEEGRGVYDNLKKFIAWTLPTDLGEGLVVLAAVLLGLPLPILPIHILWINMVTAVLLGTMLAFEPKEPGIMRRRPLDPSSAILDSVLAWRIALVGSMVMLAAFVVFQLSLSGGLSDTQARTAAANVFVIVEIFYLFNCRSLTKSVFAIGCFSNPWAWAGVLAMLAAQAVFTYAPFMNALFETEPVSLYAWLLAIGAAFAVFTVVEAEKTVRRRLRAIRENAPLPVR
jgi:Ca2+-transporting ATPase